MNSNRTLYEYLYEYLKVKVGLSKRVTEILVWERG